MNTILGRANTRCITFAFVMLAVLLQPMLADDPNIPSNVKLPAGYKLTALATGFDFPTAIGLTTDTIWVTEGGFAPGFAPKVKQIDSEGSVTTVLSGDMLPVGKLIGPLTDVTFHNGWLWITHRQTGIHGWAVGAISKFQPSDPVNTFVTVITNLPSSGDHYTEQIVFDANGRAFFSQGSATNASVVGADSGWLQTPAFQSFHEFSPVDVVLDGIAYKTLFPFPLDTAANKITSPYMPFGSGAVPNKTVVPAATPSSPQGGGIIAGGGTVYSFDPSAPDPTSTLRLEGWGFRNPYGIAFDPFDPRKLFVSNNGSDTRSMKQNSGVTVVESRPIENDLDDMFVVHPGGKTEFFGWPDFFHDPKTGHVLPVTDPLFCEQSELHFPCPQFVFDSDFRNSLRVQSAFAEFEEHSSANKFDFSTEHSFRFVGDIFVAETGSFPPVTGADEFTGYKVVRVNRQNGQVTDFIVHNSNTQDAIFMPTGFNKPIDVKIRKDTMFVVDLGVLEPGLGLMEPGTGKIWTVRPIPTLQLSLPSWLFATHPIGQTSGPGKIWIYNPGTEAAHFDGIQFTGGNQQDFAITENTCGSTLAPFTTCKVIFHFTPTAAGERNASLALNDNANDGPHVIPVRGFGSSQ
jgi:glucose/arabinose dehydrogenase